MQLTRTIETHSTGLGELTVVQRSETLLTARGLGSCIGIAVYERRCQIAVLAHVMLPGPSRGDRDPSQPARFADQAVESIIDAVERLGGRYRDCVVKLAGGAQVIRLSSNKDHLQIGQRNIVAVQAELERRGVRIAAQHVGGTVGRTLVLHAGTGLTTVRMIGSQEIPL